MYIQKQRGALLIISLLLIVVLAGLGISTMKSATTSSKASLNHIKYLEAKNKANSVLAYVKSQLDALPTDTEPTVCSSNESNCLIFSNGSIPTVLSPNSTQMNAWLEQSSQATMLFEGEGDARYTVEEVSDYINSQSNNEKLFRILAYATDRQNTASAISEAYYTWTGTNSGNYNCGGLDSNTSPGPEYGLEGTLYDTGGTRVQSLHGMMKEENKRSDTKVIMSNLNVPRQNWKDGFDKGEDTIKDANGETLNEWFGLRFNSRLTLSDTDEEGEYEFMVRSDDGATVSIKQPGDSHYSTLVENDGLHAVGKALSTDTRQKDDSLATLEAKEQAGAAVEEATNLVNNLEGALSENDLQMQKASGAEKDTLLDQKASIQQELANAQEQLAKAEQYQDTINNAENPSSVDLKKGEPLDIQIDYFQGPRYELALEFYWRKKGTESWTIVQPQNFLMPEGSTNPCVGGTGGSSTTTTTQTTTETTDGGGSATQAAPPPEEEPEEPVSNYTYKKFCPKSGNCAIVRINEEAGTATVAFTATSGDRNALHTETPSGASLVYDEDWQNLDISTLEEQSSSSDEARRIRDEYGVIF